MSQFNNGYFIWVALVIISLVVYFLFFKKSKYADRSYKLKEFLTGNEKKCFNYLLSIYPEYYIAPQVSMGALLEPIVDRRYPYRPGEQNYDSLRNAIKSNRIDFLMLNKNLLPVFVIELDDSSHDTKYESDKKRDKNLMDAGIPTLRFRNVKGKFPTRSELDGALKRLQ